jgi:hypothetical protein
VGGISLLDTAAVEQDVDPVSIFQDFGYERGNRGFGGEVCGVDCGFSVEGFD